MFRIILVGSVLCYTVMPALIAIRSLVRTAIKLGSNEEKREREKWNRKRKRERDIKSNKKKD